MRLYQLIIICLFNSCVSPNSETATFPMKVLNDGSADILLECICEMKKGKKNGKCTCFDKNNNLIIEEHYRDDVKEGEQLYFYENGHIKMTRKMVNGIRQGVSLGYYSTGEKYYYRYMKDDEIIYEKEYDKDGNIIITGLTFNVDMIEKDKLVSFDIGLTYSMYDSIYLIGLFDNNNDQIIDDTIIARQSILHYEFSSPLKGENLLSGRIIEVDANSMEEVGEGILEYEYFVE